MQNVSFKGVGYSFLNCKYSDSLNYLNLFLEYLIYYFIHLDKQNHSSSLSEIFASKLIENESAENIMKLTQNYLLKIYPAFFRTDSSNLSAIDYWTYGFQIGK